MKAKSKADATAGKQKRTAKVAKRPEPAQKEQSFNSSGKSPSIRVFRAGQDRDDAREEWMRVLQMADAESQQSFAIAQFAVQLCGLRREQIKQSWDDEDSRHKHASSVALLPGEKAKVLQDREVQLAGRIKTLDAEGFLPAAWRLLRAAREQVTRPATVEEYVAERGSNVETELAVVRHLSNKPIPFEKLCNPKRVEGDTETFFGVKWKVFTGRQEDWKKRDPWAGFEKLFWEYWSQVGQNWQLYQEGEDSTAKEMQLHYSKVEIAQIAKRARDPVVWRAQGTELLSHWMQAGLRPNDFLALARFRTARDAVRLKNIRPSEAEASKRKRRTLRTDGAHKRTDKK